MNNFTIIPSIELALTDLKLQNRLNVLAVTKKFDVIGSIFRRRWKSQSIFCKKAFSTHKQRLLAVEKEELISHINRLTDRKLSSINRIVRNLAEKQIKSSMKKNWAKNFILEHENRLKSVYLRNIDSKRIKSEYTSLFKRFYDLISDWFKRLNVKCLHIY